MSVFQRQKKTKNFQQRQRFERVARARFSRTIRKHMKDASIYSPDSVWTDEETACSEDILRLIQRSPEVTPTTFQKIYSETFPATATIFDDNLLQRTWTRLHTEYPHMFAVAMARGDLDSLNLDGTRISDLPETKPITQVSYKGWTVTIDDLQAFTIDDDLRPPVFELYARLFITNFTQYKARAVLGNCYWLFNPLQKKNKILELCRKHPIVLLPYFEKDGKTWSLLQFQRSATQASPEITPVSYTHLTLPTTPYV